MPKSSCLEWTYWRSGFDYKVASLFTGYLTAKGIIPECLNMIGQLCKRPNCLVRIYVSTNGCTDPNYRKTSFLKMLTARGVIPKSLISIHSNMPKLTKKNYLSCTDGHTPDPNLWRRTDLNCRKTLFLKMLKIYNIHV